MKKKIMSVLCVILSIVMLVGCSSGSKPAASSAAPAASGASVAPASSAAPAEKPWKFERKIEMVIPFGPGSGTDTTIRAWAPLMEKELGVAITINNVEGAGGVKGAEYLNKQPADGYTFAMYTPSHIIAAVNKTTTFDILNETVPTVRLVQDANVILANKNVPYNNVKELIAYVKANPDKAKIGVMSVVGIDGVSVQQLFDLAGIKVGLVPFGSGAEANAAVIGGHIDMVLTSPFDANAYLTSGDMKGIVTLSEKRASNMPKVECTGELGYAAYLGPWRGIIAKKGTPDGAVKALAAAADKVNNSKAWQDWKASVALNDREGYANNADFTKIWTEYYNTMKKALGK